MLIRKPPQEVYEAFADPAATTRFWFTRSTGRLEPGATVTWYWDMYGVSAQVNVIATEPSRRVAIEWPTPVEWVFEPRDRNMTLVKIKTSGFTGADDEQVARAIDNVGGFSFVLASCKAFLEHGIDLNLIADHDPDALVR